MDQKEIFSKGDQTIESAMCKLKYFLSKEYKICRKLFLVFLRKKAYSKIILFKSTIH